MYLDLARNDLGFAGVAATPNQIAVAQALTRTVNSGGGSPAMQTVLNNLTGVSTAQARTAFDTMSGASLRGLSDAARVFMNASTQLVTARQRRLDGDGSMALRSFGFMPLQLTAAEFFSDALPDYGELRNAQTSASWRTREAPRGLWGRAYGTRNDTRDGATNGFHLSGEGFMIGMDGQLNDRWRMGTAIGTGTQRLDVNNVADSGKSRGVTLALYGQYADGPWTVQGLVAAGRNRNYSERHIIVGGTASVATADYTSNAVTAYGEAAYSVFRRGYVLEPMLALSYTRLRNPSFTEQGAGPLALSVNAETRHSTRTFVGTRLVHRIETRAGTFTVEPRLLWAHEFGDVETAPISAQLTGAGAASAFNVRGVATDRDSAVFGLGLTSQLSKNLKLSADAGAELKSGQSVYGFFAGLRYAW
jgi:outer membrane autotransporter protein